MSSVQLWLAFCVLMSLLKRQFAWNIKSCIFSRKNKKISICSLLNLPIVCCVIRPNRKNTVRMQIWFNSFIQSYCPYSWSQDWNDPSNKQIHLALSTGCSSGCEFHNLYQRSRHSNPPNCKKWVSQLTNQNWIIEDFWKKNNYLLMTTNLTLKVPITTTADDILIIFQRN